MAGIRKIEFVASQKGTPQVLLDGYVYNKNAVRQTCIHWKCVKSLFNGRLSTSGDFVRNVTDHNHAPYIVSTWVDDDARFPIQLWNHPLTVGPRTNNNLEGFHSRLNQTLPHRHPNIFRFTEVIKKIEAADKAKIAQLEYGAAPPTRKRIYRETENRLLRLKDKLLTRQKTPLEFLDAVGHLLKLA
ncbi:uncharacterized protein [Haliotis asinina]|uniref:uncharacterized protein n=1 Tax=Haliotis asinina TaxID=109174 RepID=UPI0035319B05